MRTIYEALLLIRDYSDKYDAKLDYQINDRMSSFLRFSQRKDMQYYQPDISGPSGGGGNGFIHAIQQQAAIGYTWTRHADLAARSALWLHSRAGGQDSAVSGRPEPAGSVRNPRPADFAQPDRRSEYADRQRLQRASAGRPRNPQFQNPTSFNPKLNYSWVRGRHSLKTGYEFVAIRTEVLDVNPLYGADTYARPVQQADVRATGTGGGCTIPSDATSYNLADFMFGLPSTIQLGNNFVTNLRQHVHSLYVQDDYRVTSKLTLNLGLRWEFATPIWERDNNWTNFDPGDQHAGQGDQRQPVQPRAGASGLQGLRTAPRAGVQRSTRRR